MLASLFHLIVGLTLAALPTYAWIVRGRPYAMFALVILAFSMPGLVIGHARLVALAPASSQPWIDAGFCFAVATAGIHLTHLVRARLRGGLFRWGISVPGQTSIAAGFMLGIWLLALLPLRVVLTLAGADAVLDALRWLDVLPLLLAAISVQTSTRPVMEHVRVQLSNEGPEEITRMPVERHRRRAPTPSATRPLRIVQITDPHLGPWQPVTSLQRTIDRLLDHEPDLVLLTGDFLMMEGNGTPGALEQALAPLKRRAQDCYAIFGNHDHEAPDQVRDALRANGIRLLVDEETVADTPAGPVQILGSDHHPRRDQTEKLGALLERFPRIDEHLRLLLLHDPLRFHDVPAGDVDLTLSGHTHGGQVGLVSLGLDWTVLTRSRWPDHGLFARGASHLYVHRGTGFYGFPLRVGVPGEASLMEVLAAPAPVPT
jgi:predicted MPP superfamily phosphohydrolase